MWHVRVDLRIYMVDPLGGATLCLLDYSTMRYDVTLSFLKAYMGVYDSGGTLLGGGCCLNYTPIIGNPILKGRSTRM